MINETSAVVILAVVLWDLFQSLFKWSDWKVAIKKVMVLSLPFVSLVLWYLYHWMKAGWMVNLKLFINKDRVLTLFQDNLFRHLIYDRSGENVNGANWIIFIVLIVYSVSQAVKRKSVRLECFLFIIIILNILFFSFADDLPRYFLIVYPFYFILGARAFVNFSGMVKPKNMILFILVLTVVSFPLKNFWGRRDADGWRLESNMEYLDMVRTCQSAARFIEDGYAEYKIITTFPLIFALENPPYGYVIKPLSLIPLEKFDSFDEVLVVRSFRPTTSISTDSWRNRGTG